MRVEKVMDVSFEFYSPDPCQGYNLHPCSDVYLGADVLLKFALMQSFIRCSLLNGSNQLSQQSSFPYKYTRDGIWGLCFCLHAHMYTFETRVGCSGVGEIRLWFSPLWWQKASFPPSDENHVSGATCVEECMVSENTSAGASSQWLDGHLSCLWFFPFPRSQLGDIFCFLSAFSIFLYSSISPHAHAHSHTHHSWSCVHVCTAILRNLGRLCFCLEVGMSQQDWTLPVVLDAP